MIALRRNKVFSVMSVVFLLCTINLFIRIEIHPKNTGLFTFSNKKLISRDCSKETEDTRQTNLTTQINEIEITTAASETVKATSKTNVCPNHLDTQKGLLNIQFDRSNKSSNENWPPTLEEIAKNYTFLEIGGSYPGPSSCTPKQNIAIIIPFRDREEHLKFFLHYMHELLHRQPISYRIFVVEQDDNRIFNKGQMMNSGFLFVSGIQGQSYDCVFFHDVDTIAEDDRTPYLCRNDSEIVHLAYRIDKYNYKLCCGMTIGGVFGTKPSQYKRINGFSNSYYGWGGEDDDMFARMTKVAKFSVYRPSENYVKYKMIRHVKDKRNAMNVNRFSLLNQWRTLQPKDGLNSLNTTITKVVNYPTHTRILVQSKPNQHITVVRPQPP